MSFGVSRIKAVGVGIVPTILLVIGSPAIVAALTKEEASRCRAMRNYIERRDCFASLREELKAKAEEAAKAKTGNAPSPSAPDAPATSSAIDRSLGGDDRQSNSGSLAMFAAMRQVSLSLCNREWKTRPLAAALRFLHERVYRIAERPMLRPGAGIGNMRTPKERGIPHLFADGAPIDPTKQKDGRSPFFAFLGTD